MLWLSNSVSQTTPKFSILKQEQFITFHNSVGWLDGFLLYTISVWTLGRSKMLSCSWQVVGDCWLGIQLGLSAKSFNSPPCGLLHMDACASSHHRGLKIAKHFKKHNSESCQAFLGSRLAQSHFRCTLLVMEIGRCSLLEATKVTVH